MAHRSVVPQVVIGGGSRRDGELMVVLVVSDATEEGDVMGWGRERKNSCMVMW